MQEDSFVGILKAAAPFGGGIALLLVIVAAASWVGRRALELRSEALKRARTADIPQLLGDEIDKLKLKLRTEDLSQKQRYDLVVRILDQRAARQKQLFIGALVVASLATVIALVGIIAERPQENPISGAATPLSNLAQGGLAPSAATPVAINAPTSPPTSVPCAGARVGDLKANDSARVNVGTGTPCPSVERLEAAGSAKIDVGSAK
jgi:hypothetical protein